MFKRAGAVIAAGVVAAGIALGAAACTSRPDTVAAKYQCGSKTVNGESQPQYCYTDSQGNSFYLNYAVWRGLTVGSDVSKSVPPADRQSSDDVPSDDIPPGIKTSVIDPEEDNQGNHNSGGNGDDGGGDDGGDDGGGHAGGGVDGE